MKSSTYALLSAALLVLLAVQTWGRYRLQTANFVLGTPIFTPVSLDYERKLRAGPPVTTGDVAKRLQAALDSGTDFTQAELERLQTWRMEMLELRNQRHALNVELMIGAVELAAVLTPDQWEMLSSQRDHLKSKIELDIFEELLRRLEQRSTQ